MDSPVFPRSHRRAHSRWSKLRSAARERDRRTRPPALEPIPAAVLRVAFAFGNRVGIGTEDLPVAADVKEWGKRNRKESTEGEGGRGYGKDDGSHIDNFEAGRTSVSVDEGRRAVGWERPEWFEFSGGQAGGWVEIDLVGDGACLRSLFACDFAITLAG